MKQYQFCSRFGVRRCTTVGSAGLLAGGVACGRDGGVSGFVAGGGVLAGVVGGGSAWWVVAAWSVVLGGSVVFACGVAYWMARATTMGAMMAVNTPATTFPSNPPDFSSAMGSSPPWAPNGPGQL